MIRSEDLLPIAAAAGEIILGYYKTGVAVEAKDDDTPVTVADKEASASIVAALNALDPETPVISEELPVPGYDVRKNWKKFWIIDPLDGTREFIKQTDDFTVNIALIEGDTPTVGMIYAPVHDLFYFADKGGGAWKKTSKTNKEKIFSSQGSAPFRVIHSRSNSEAETRAFVGDHEISEFLAQGSSLKFGTLAEGRVDLYARMAPCKEWDIAAGDLIYRESGKNGPRKSSLVYNKESLYVEPFLLGLD